MSHVPAKVIPMEVEAQAVPMPMPGGVSIAAPAPMGGDSVGHATGPYGSHVSIQTASGNSIAILHKAEFDWYSYYEFCLGGCGCCKEQSRKYFYVLENAVEYNYPVGFSDNCLCIGVDLIFKTYFDRGPWDQQSLLRKIGCVRGTPTVFANQVQHVCFCTDCPAFCNNYLECYFPTCCGERVRVLNAEYVYFCIPTRANFCCNCCGLYGVKTGEPLPCCATALVATLKEGAGAPLASAIESARAQWRMRTNNP